MDAMQILSILCVPSRYDQFVSRFVPGGTNRVRALRADRDTAPAAERIVGNETASKLPVRGARPALPRPLPPRKPRSPRAARTASGLGRRSILNFF
jgi:hypothetical protein